MDLTNKVAIITGAGTGVGAATAKLLATKGCHVAINYCHSQTEAEVVKDACVNQGVKAITCQGDISVDADCQRIATVTAKELGGIDILINNAGTTNIVPYEKLELLNAEDFQQIYATNVIGTYQMVRASLEYLKQGTSSAIVNVSSTAALNGQGSSMAYAASKGALNSLTLALARTLSKYPIRVNAICPSLIEDTPWFTKRAGEQAFNAFKQSIMSSVALGRLCTAQDVANAIVSIIGMETLTGEIIRLDSGTHLVGL